MRYFEKYAGILRDLQLKILRKLGKSGKRAAEELRYADKVWNAIQSPSVQKLRLDDAATKNLYQSIIRKGRAL